MENKQRVYMRNYRKTYGDLMKQQIREWCKQHTDYFNKWRQLHPGYHKAWQIKNYDHYCEYQKHWREQHRAKINIYMRKYMQQYRRRRALQ
ncbi:hypothetical protein ES703_70417 [subsurface metagenome]